MSISLSHRPLQFAPTLVILGLGHLLIAANLLAGIHPKSLPRPPLETDIFVSGTNMAKNAGFFEITNSIGAAIHKVKKGDSMLIRCIRPPDRSGRPGSIAFTRYNRGTLNRGTEQVIIVENKGNATDSFRLRVTESNATDWENDYLLEGNDERAAMTSPDGDLLANLPSGEKRQFDASLRPGNASLTPGSLDTTMEIEPVSEMPDHFEVRITVTNRNTAQATSTSPRIVFPPGASSSEGTLPYHFVSGTYLNPVFVNIDAGTSHTYIGTMELPLPDPH